MKRLLFACSVLLALMTGAHAESLVVSTCGTLPLAYAPGATRLDTVDLNGNKCITGNISTSVTFPTIGAAVPATGIYNGINVSGTLRGVTGLGLGSTFSQTVAVVDGSGNQITSFSGSNASVGATGAAVPASATYVGITSGGNLTGWTGAVTNAGTFATQSAQSGTWNIGTVTAVTAISNALPAGTNAIGSVGLAAGTTGGCTPGHIISAAATTGATVLKGSAGTLCKVVVVNTTTTLYYLKFYDKATTPACNSDTVVATYAVPYGASNTGGGVVVPIGPFGEAYTSGIGLCLTGGIADNDNTNAGTGVSISFSTK